MPQTKEGPRLIQRESGRIAVAIIKNLVDSSAIMNRAFGRVGSDECARRASRRVGGPACLPDGCGFGAESVTFHKQDDYVKVLRTNHSLAGCSAESRSGGALRETPKQLGAGRSCRSTGRGVNAIFSGKEISYDTSIYDAKE